MRFELRSAYLRLLTSLHLDHQVQTRLLMRGEFVLPRSECTSSIPLFKAPSKSPSTTTATTTAAPSTPKSPFTLKQAPLPGCSLLAGSIQHNITSKFCQSSSDQDTLDFSVEELKELVFHSLEKLLHSDYYKMYLLPTDSRSPIFVPMIEALDRLLVMGVLNSEQDLERLLHLLDPTKFFLPDSPSESQQSCMCLLIFVVSFA